MGFRGISRRFRGLSWHSRELPWALTNFHGLKRGSWHIIILHRLSLRFHDLSWAFIALWWAVMDLHGSFIGLSWQFHWLSRTLSWTRWFSWAMMHFHSSLRVHGTFMAISYTCPWKIHETAVKVSWRHHESAMKALGKSRGVFMGF